MTDPILQSKQIADGIVAVMRDAFAEFSAYFNGVKIEIDTRDLFLGLETHAEGIVAGLMKALPGAGIDMIFKHIESELFGRIKSDDTASNGLRYYFDTEGLQQ